jgi:alpha-N-arabinofuranosidase
MVFLAFRPYGGTHPLDRETCLTPFTWSSNGWPVIPDHGTAMIENHVPALSLHPFTALPVRDEFSAQILSPLWSFLGNPVAGTWSLQEHKGYLRIYGQQGNLDSAQSPQMLAQRLTSLSCEAATELVFDPHDSNEEAGLTAYQSAAGHYDCFVRKRNGVREAVLRIVLGHIHYEQKIMPLEPGPVRLQVTIGNGLYRFSVSQNGRSITMGDGDVRFLSQEVAGGWLGAHLGIYAAGNKKNSRAPADFNWFELRNF